MVHELILRSSNVRLHVRLQPFEMSSSACAFGSFGPAGLLDGNVALEGGHSTLLFEIRLCAGRKAFIVLSLQ